MTNVPDQLDQSSLLLMYLAEELPARERAALEKRLASEKALSAQLDELRQIQARFETQMRHLDAASTAYAHAALVGRISHAMQEHGVAQMNRETENLEPRRVLRFPVWAYPIAAAAAVALVYIARFAFAPVQGPPARTFVIEPSADDDQVMFAVLKESFTNQDPAQSGPLESLRSAESELADIASLTRNENLPDLFNDEPTSNWETNQ